MKETICILNIIGLALDFFGALKLYKMKFKPVEIKYDQSLDVMRYDGRNPGYEAISRAIQRSNKLNEVLHKSTKKWFHIILLGFILQLLSVVLGVFTNSVASSEAHATQNVERNK